VKLTVDTTVASHRVLQAYARKPMHVDSAVTERMLTLAPSDPPTVRYEAAGVVVVRSAEHGGADQPGGGGCSLVYEWVDGGGLEPTQAATHAGLLMSAPITVAASEVRLGLGDLAARQGKVLLATAHSAGRARSEIVLWSVDTHRVHTPTIRISAANGMSMGCATPHATIFYRWNSPPDLAEIDGARTQAGDADPTVHTCRYVGGGAAMAVPLQGDRDRRLLYAVAVAPNQPESAVAVADVAACLVSAPDVWSDDGAVSLRLSGSADAAGDDGGDDGLAVCVLNLKEAFTDAVSVNPATAFFIASLTADAAVRCTVGGLNRLAAAATAAATADTAATAAATPRFTIPTDRPQVLEVSAVACKQDLEDSVVRRFRIVVEQVPTPLLQLDLARRTFSATMPPGSPLCRLEYTLVPLPTPSGGAEAGAVLGAVLGSVAAAVAVEAAVAATATARDAGHGRPQTGWRVYGPEGASTALPETDAQGAPAVGPAMLLLRALRAGMAPSEVAQAEIVPGSAAAALPAVSGRLPSRNGDNRSGASPHASPPPTGGGGGEADLLDDFAANLHVPSHAAPFALHTRGRSLRAVAHFGEVAASGARPSGGPRPADGRTVVLGLCNDVLVIAYKEEAAHGGQPSRYVLAAPPGSVDDVTIRDGVFDDMVFSLVLRRPGDPADNEQILALRANSSEQLVRWTALINAAASAVDDDTRDTWV
jgi:hypothetical protein